MAGNVLPWLHMKSLALLVIGAFGVVTCFSPAASAQTISGDAVGTVQDSSGAAIANVSVSAVNQGTNTRFTGTTNNSGEYRISNLLPGVYSFTAAQSGFSTSTIKDVRIDLNKTSTVVIVLQVSNVAGSIEVTSSGATIDTTTAQIAGTYDSKQTSSLPNVIVGQGVINLSLLQAGVASSGGIGVGTGPSIGGQRPRNNNFAVDGVDNNAKSTTGPLVNIPNDFVAEFTLIQNQFRAEYGHSSGGQFNTIIKTGTNSFHGQIYDYLRNRNLNAVDQVFANQKIYSNPRYDQNRLGGDFGGPVVKNKLFFFGGFEYKPTGQASTQGSPVYAPTAGAYAALSGLAGVSQTNLGILKTYATGPDGGTAGPSLTVGGVTVPTSQLQIVAPNFNNNYSSTLSIDYSISDKDQLRGRYSFQRSDAINTGATLPVFYTTVPSRVYLPSLAEYHTFNPNLTNEFRYGYQRQNTTSVIGNQTFPGLDQFPNLQFNNLGLQLGPNPNFPQATISNQHQYTDAITWIRGKHTIKIGSEFRYYISPQFFSQRVRGDYNYVNVVSFLQDFTPDFLAQRNVGGRKYYGNQKAIYAFGQDSWRVTSKLTLDLGLRYEYTTVPRSMQDQALNAGASAAPLLPIGKPTSDSKGIAPRIGIAYTPGKSGDFVIRAGFGLAYDVIFDNLGLNTVPPQYAVTVDQTGLGGTNFLKNGGITAASLAPTTSVAGLRANTGSFIPNQLLPYSINYNFGIQKVIAKDYTLEIRYVGTKGVHQIIQQQINRLSPVTATRNIPTLSAAPSLSTLQSLPLTVGDLRAQGSLDPVYAALGFTGTLTSYRPEGYSQYNGLAIQLNRRFNRSVLFGASYTWSHNIDNSTAEVATTYLTPRRAQNFNLESAEKASSALDRRQRFTFNAVIEDPFFKTSGNWFLKNLVGNWQVSPVYSYETPEYFTVQSGLDSNLNGDAAPDRTIINSGGTAHTGSDVYGLDRAGNRINLPAKNADSAPIVAYVATNPNARYIRAGYGAYANAGRNTEATRPINNIDLSILKRFNITERMSLELSGQFLNVFNHAQFIPGSINDSSTVNTFSPGTLNYVTASNSLFNNPEKAFSSNPRNLIVVAKFIF